MAFWTAWVYFDSHEIRAMCNVKLTRGPEGKLNAVKLVELYLFYFNLTVLILVKVGKVLD